MFKNKTIYDNFESLDKFWEPFNNAWVDEIGNGVSGKNVGIEEVNVSNEGTEMKKCLVIKANGDKYNKKEPTGFKKVDDEIVEVNKSKRVGGGVVTKYKLGSGIYDMRVKFSKDNIFNALWLYRHVEFNKDDYRHKDDERYNDKNNNTVINSEIDLEYPIYKNNRKDIRINTYKSTEDNSLFTENDINLQNLNLKLDDDKWHNVRFEWETGLVNIKNIIGRDLYDDEIVLVNEVAYINNIQLKKYNKLNGYYINIDDKLNKTINYGKSIKVFIDDIEIYSDETNLDNFDYNKFMNNKIPNIKSYFMIALWFSDALEDKCDYETTKMYLDYFNYTPNDDFNMDINNK
tara:strand:+ start:2665 stop:3702 length:1038 start_codon:yes stop_codon:yes gene_type:complete